MVTVQISPNEENLAKVLDQSNATGISYIQFGGLKVCAQSFKLGTTGYVSEVELYIADSDDVDSGVYTMTLEIQSDDGGDPDGTALGTATRTVINTGISQSNKRWVKFKFSPDERPNLTATTTYWLVLSSPTTNVFWWVHNLLAGDPYSDGQRAKSSDGGSTWVQHATHDHVFRIYRLSSFSINDIGAFVTGLSWSRRTNASTSASLELANMFGKFTNENMTNPAGQDIGNYLEISRGMSIVIKIPDGSSTTTVFRGIIVSDPSQSSRGGNTISIEALGNLELSRKRYIAKRYREYDYDILTSIDYTVNPGFESRLTYVEDIVDNLVYTQTDLFSNYGIQFAYDRLTNPDILHLIKKEFIFDYKTVFECIQILAEATAQEYYINNDNLLILQDIKDPTDATSSSYPILSRGDNIVADNMEENYDNLRNQVIVEGKDGKVVVEEDLESIETYGLVPYYEKNNDIETEEELATYAQLLLKKYITINRTGNIELKEFTERCTSTIPNSFLSILPGEIIEVKDELIGLYDFTNDTSTFYRVDGINFTYDGSLKINLNIASIKTVPELVDLQIERNLQKQTTGGEDSIDVVTTRTCVIKVDDEGTYSTLADNDSRIGRYDSGNYDSTPSVHTSKYGV